MRGIIPIKEKINPKTYCAYYPYSNQPNANVTLNELVVDTIENIIKEGETKNVCFPKLGVHKIKNDKGNFIDVSEDGLALVEAWKKFVKDELQGQLIQDEGDRYKDVYFISDYRNTSFKIAIVRFNNQTLANIHLISNKVNYQGDNIRVYDIGKNPNKTFKKMFDELERKIERYS